MTNEIKIELCSPADRKKLVAAIMIDGEQFAEVNQESGLLAIEIYPRQDGQPWAFDFETAVNALVKAKEKLTQL